MCHQSHQCPGAGSGHYCSAAEWEHLLQCCRVRTPCAVLQRACSQGMRHFARSQRMQIGRIYKIWWWIHFRFKFNRIQIKCSVMLFMLTYNVMHCTLASFHLFINPPPMTSVLLTLWWCDDNLSELPSRLPISVVAATPLIFTKALLLHYVTQRNYSTLHFLWSPNQNNK